jgi:hypothetical protein
MNRGHFVSLSDETLTETVKVAQEASSRTEAAHQLGISERTLRVRLAQATSRNITGDYAGGALPAGRTLGKVTVHYRNGNVVDEWQRQEPGEAELEAFAEELIKTMQSEITPLKPVLNQPSEIDPSLLTLYPMADVHLGQFSWGKETGENYDLKIAKSQFMTSVTKLMRSTPPSEVALIVMLGDYYHADNNEAQTHKSHNHLDVDGRHDKVLHLGVELAVWMIDMALQQHNSVIVHVTRGNHDPMSSKLLATALFFRYQENPRVTIDRSPKDLWSYQWGKNMLSFTHGDMVKAADMPGVMAAFEPEMWGATEFRFGFSGHFHRASKGPLGDEKHGAQWEILPAFTAKDAWNKAMGFSGKRGIVSKTFHATEGLQYTGHINIV